MTDSAADPRIALIHKWSLENPSLMAQAGLMAQPAPALLHETSRLDAETHGYGADEHTASSFIGGKAKLKKAKKKLMNAQKEYFRAHGMHYGAQEYYGPTPLMPARFRPGFQPVHNNAWGDPNGQIPPRVVMYSPAHNRPNPQHTAHRAHQQQHRKTAATLTQELNVKMAEYEKTIDDEKTHLTNAFSKMETTVQIKGKAILMLNRVYSLMSTNNADEVQKWNEITNSINTELVDFGKDDVDSKLVNHHGIKQSLNFENIPSDSKKLWGYGYLIKEIILVVEKFIRATFDKKELKTKTYYDHILRISTLLRKQRSGIQTLLDAKKRAEKIESVSTNTAQVSKPVMITRIDGTQTSIQRQ